MLGFSKRFGLPALAGLGVLILTGSATHAQNPYFRMSPQVVDNVSMLGKASAAMPVYGMGQAAAAPYRRMGTGDGGGGGAGGNLMTSPYQSSYGGGGYNPMYPPYGYESAVGGFLRGTASIIDAQGQFMVNQQQSNILRQQAMSEKIANRRRVFDNYLYERAMTPTVEQFREEDRLRNLDRSRIDPPVNEIYSAKALNDVLIDLQNLQATTRATDPSTRVPINEEMLRQVNVTTTKGGGGNLGLLRSGAGANWPIALTSDEFKTERERLTTLAGEAVKQAEFNRRVDANTIRQMLTDVDSLQEQLRRSVATLSANQYMEAKRYLSEWEEALKGLQQPDVGKHFDGAYTLKGKTAAEVVDFMTKNGLRFAPAVPGNEAAYLSLHRALANYDQAVHTVVAEKR